MKSWSLRRRKGPVPDERGREFRLNVDVTPVLHRRSGVAVQEEGFSVLRVVPTRLREEECGPVEVVSARVEDVVDGDTGVLESDVPAGLPSESRPCVPDRHPLGSPTTFGVTTRSPGERVTYPDVKRVH